MTDEVSRVRTVFIEDMNFWISGEGVILFLGRRVKSDWRIASPLTGLVVVLLCVFINSADSDAADADASLQVEVTLGFNGRFKQGTWTPVHVEITNENTAKFQGRLVLESPDGEGIAVRFVDRHLQLTVPPTTTVTRTAYIKIGRLPWSVVVSVVDDTNQQAAFKKTFGRLDDGQLSTTDFLILQIGNRLPLSASRLQTELTGRPDLVEVAIQSQTRDYHKLPDRWYGYAAVDLLIITTSAEDLLEQLSTQQQQAIRQWIYQGGRMLLFAGQRGPELSQDNEVLGSLIPGKIDRVITNWNTSGIEKYGNADERLILNRQTGSSLSLITPSDGVVVLRDTQNAQAEHALIVHSARGLGSVTFVAFDPDQEPFASWGATPAILNRLVINSHFAERGNEQLGKGFKSSNAGFDDISGQLRSSLDRFDGVTPTRFMWVAGLLGMFILVIGPLDYYILRRFKRLHWTWVTFPVAILVFSLIAVLMVSALRTSPPALNQIEIVDIDSLTQTVRGSNYATVYSPTTAAYSLEMSEFKNSMRSENQQVLACWQGFPGAGLGGLGRSSFQVLIDHQYEVDLADGQIRSIPVQHSGTRSLAARWSADASLVVKSALVTEPASGALRGTLQNPFDFDLHDALILFDGRVYPIGQVFTPNSVVNVYDLSSDSQGIDNYFTRFQSGSRRQSYRVWRATDESRDRVVKQMMFDQEIGGVRYTGLLHRYQSYLDLSHMLRLRRAVLVGKAGKNHGMTEFVNSSQQNGDGPLESQVDRYYRVVLPVNMEATTNTLLN